VVRLWSVVDGLNEEGCRSFSPQAALGFDLLFNCSEVDITHTPNLAKIFVIIFLTRGPERQDLTVVVPVMGWPVKQVQAAGF
jgi:hypothetical protein